MSFAIEHRGGRGPRPRPEFTRVGEDRIIASTTWLDDEGRHVERYQVFTIRDGKIVDLQGCTSRRQAERFSRSGKPS